MGGESPLAVLLLLLPWILISGIGIYVIVITVRLLSARKRDD